MPDFAPDSEPVARSGWRARVWLCLWAIFLAAGSLASGVPAAPATSFLRVPAIDAPGNEGSPAILPAEALRDRATVDRRSPRVGASHVPGAGAPPSDHPAVAAILPPEPLPTPGQCCRPTTVPVAIVLPGAGFCSAAHFPTGPPFQA